MGGSGGAAVDPRTAFALCVNRSLEQQLAIGGDVGEAFVGQPIQDFSGGVELCTNFGASCAFAYHAGFSTGAQHQLKGVYQNRFASTGLAGERRKATRQIEVQFAHDHKIAQNDVLQTHATPSFQCSF